MPSKDLVMGLDYGTDSVRTVLVDAQSGEEVSSASFEYPRWKGGKYCSPSENRFRQHPMDYIEGLEHSVHEALNKAYTGAWKDVKGMTIDTTGSTPCAVNELCEPLALTQGFEENPNAMFILWKDHTATEEAQRINDIAHKWKTDYTRYSGKNYSSEWFWAKILHILKRDEGVRNAAYSWMEHCDWMSAMLCGCENIKDAKRSRCAAGHKAMWHESFGGLPDEDFLREVDPLLGGLRGKLYTETYSSDKAAGRLSKQWAQRLGLTEGITVGVGALDAHMGAVGGEIQPYWLSKVMGTSTCDMLVAPKADIGERTISGISGQVDGSIIPGMIGMEAGQSAFGDVYAWFKNLLSWALSDDDSAKDEILPKLNEEAQKIAPDISLPLAVDWFNGRRTPDANQLLKAGIMNLSLGSSAPQVFRALVEATAFGARAIIDRYISEGVRIDGLIALGGIAKKSPFVMQTTADVLERPISIVKSEETCALGSAMFASVAAGIHSDIGSAIEKMGQGFEKEYKPDESRAEIYRARYQKYIELGKYIEKENRRD